MTDIEYTHWLQIERGATCMVVGSAGRTPTFVETLHKARERVDSCRPGPAQVDAVAGARATCDGMLERVKAALERIFLDADAKGAKAADANARLQAVASESVANFAAIFLEYNALCERSILKPIETASARAPSTELSRCGACTDTDSSRTVARTCPLVSPRAADDLSPPRRRDFALLKNTYGVERAFLCGALALPTQPRPSRPLPDLSWSRPAGALALPTEALSAVPPHASSALVVNLQRQRALIERIQTRSPPRALELIGAAFELTPPELRDVHNELQRSLDVAALKSGGLRAARWFELMTAHIDKLEPPAGTESDTEEGSCACRRTLTSSRRCRSCCTTSRWPKLSPPLTLALALP